MLEGYCCVHNEQEFKQLYDDLSILSVRQTTLLNRLTSNQYMIILFHETILEIQIEGSIMEYITKQHRKSLNFNILFQQSWLMIQGVGTC